MQLSEVRAIGASGHLLPFSFLIKRTFPRRITRKIILDNCANLLTSVEFDACVRLFCLRGEKGGCKFKEKLLIESFSYFYLAGELLGRFSTEQVVAASGAGRATALCRNKCIVRGKREFRQISAGVEFEYTFRIVARGR